MEKDNADNFTQILQLLKQLDVENRSTRQETNKIELLLKRVAQQSSISYEKLSKTVNDTTSKQYRCNSFVSKEEELINDNYRLLYEIEQQDYINKKIINLINTINEHLSNIKNYIIEQKLTRKQDMDNFIYEMVQAKQTILNNSYEQLRTRNEVITDNVQVIIHKFQQVYKEINWDLIPKDNEHYIALHKLINQFQDDHGISLA